MKLFNNSLFGIFILIIFSTLTTAITGTGTNSNPYNISSCSDLQNMSLDINGNYQLISNVDCSDTINWDSGAGFMPTGDSDCITGNLKGNNHTITNLFINRPSLDYAALIECIYDGNITNLGLVNVNITGKKYSAGLIGVAWSVNISEVYVKGNIYGLQGSGEAASGGIVGYMDAGQIHNSYFQGNIFRNDTPINNPTGNDVGGLVGLSHGNIFNSYSTGTVSNNGGFLENAFSVGGLIGYGSSDTVSNSFTSDTVYYDGTTPNYLGGFCGSCSISDTAYWFNATASIPKDCYSGGNTNCVAITPIISNSYFYNISSSPINLWDFVSIWDNINDGIDYPTLQWEATTTTTTSTTTTSTSTTTTSLEHFDT